jgi:sodium-dependent phosphate cotransporter
MIPPDPDTPSPIVQSHRKGMPTPIRAALVVALLYLFLVGVKLLEKGVKGLGDETAGGLFEGITSPLAALFVGILATVLVQSSSVTTATIVGLVAANVLPLETAVPMIMGANIGTTVTNTIVSLASARNSEGFRLAFSAATMHDFFNLIAVAILLPLEIATGFLLKFAIWIADLLPIGSDATFDSPIKAAVSWGATKILDLLALITSNEQALWVTAIIVGIAIIFATLTFITKNMKILIAARIESSMNAALARSGTIGMAVGVLVTIAVQSSSITTSILVPLVASGILLLRNAYPITLGANIGTTITALLAALATGTLDGMTIALVHLLFNVIAILLIYPIPKIRYIPVDLAERLASVAMTRKTIAIAYVLVVFIAVPIVGIVIFS